jgi:hypothetical protein
MRRGSLWEYKEGQLLGGMDLAGNIWLSARSRRSDLYFKKQ